MVLAATAAMAFAAPVSAAGQSSVNRHCVISLDPVAPGETTSNVLAVRCFASFNEAIVHATGGRVHLAANAGPKDFLPESVTATPTVLSIDYKDGGWGGATWTATANNSYGCANNHSYAINSMPATWDNQVSSARVYGSCDRFEHWENTSHTGAHADCSPCSYIGDAMNDRTSSEQWFDS